MIGPTVILKFEHSLNRNLSHDVSSGTPCIQMIREKCTATYGVKYIKEILL